jgi:hypothetical protein
MIFANFFAWFFAWLPMWTYLDIHDAQVRQDASPLGISHSEVEGQEVAGLSEKFQ